jgi:hypothetical protein
MNIHEERVEVMNAAELEAEMRWLEDVIDASIRLYLGNECAITRVDQIEPPNIQFPQAPFGQTVLQSFLNWDERLILALATAPLVRPQLLDPFLVKNPNLNREFCEFGGTTQALHRGFQPTVETALFILGGRDLSRRFEALCAFDADGRLRRANLLELDESHSLTHSPLILSRQCHSLFTTGISYRPSYSSAFPARRLTTGQEWEELVLPDETMEDVVEIRAWIKHRNILLHDWQLASRIKPGFRSLFYGLPGTGKTLTASLLGKTTGLDVYRVDLSLVVSKWVGETEKNLASVFDEAEKNDWILFFDEADALFGKRSQSASSHDRYANQEVAYLLQRIEDFTGIVILASNLKGNLDEAFSRRFQSIVYFPMPTAIERARLWSSAFATIKKIEPSVNFVQLGREFELNGGAIVNVLRYSALMSLRRGEDVVRLADIRQGIRREFQKSGKTV